MILCTQASPLLHHATRHVQAQCSSTRGGYIVCSQEEKEEDLFGTMRTIHHPPSSRADSRVESAIRARVRAFARALRSLCASSVLRSDVEGAALGVGGGRAKICKRMFQ